MPYPNALNAAKPVTGHSDGAIYIADPTRGDAGLSYASLWRRQESRQIAQNINKP